MTRKPNLTPKVAAYSPLPPATPPESLIKNIWLRPTYVPSYTPPARPGAEDFLRIPSRRK